LIVRSRVGFVDLIFSKRMSWTDIQHRRNLPHSMLVRVDSWALNEFHVTKYLQITPLISQPENKLIDFNLLKEIWITFGSQKYFMFAEFQTFEHYNAFLLIISSQISYLNKRAPDSVIAFPWTFIRLNHLLDEREGKKSRNIVFLQF